MNETVTHPPVGRLEYMALRALAELGEYGMYYPFRAICDHDGLPHDRVRRAVRGLARKGLAQYARGLCTEDGDFAGSGYCCTELGWRVYEALARPEFPKVQAQGTKTGT